MKALILPRFIRWYILTKEVGMWRGIGSRREKMGVTSKCLEVLSVVFSSAEEMGETAACMKKEKFIFCNRDC